MDERSPLVVRSQDRDEYCQTKLFQESIIQETASRRGWRTVILRPGVIYGRNNLWTARLGMQISDRWWLAVGLFAPLPLTYVENCADAIVRAAEYDGPERNLVLNLVDGETPTQQAYRSALRRQLPVRPRVIPIPWILMRCLARMAWLINRLCFGGTAKLPGLLVPARLHARFKPLRYRCDAARTVLGWKPLYSWQQGIQRSLASVDAAELLPTTHPVTETPAATVEPVA